MTWRSDAFVERFLIRETDSAPFQGGPHRPIRLPAEGETLKVALGDRPALSSLLTASFHAAGDEWVCAAPPEGGLWLNNRGLSEYLQRVPDAPRH